MIRVLVGGNATPTQVDDFPIGCERSVQGAIHFRPGSMKKLTQAEYNWVKSKHTELARKLTVVAEDTRGTDATVPQGPSIAPAASAPVTDIPTGAAEAALGGEEK